MNKNHQKILMQHQAKDIIDTLDQFLTERRKQRIGEI